MLEELARRSRLSLEKIMQLVKSPQKDVTPVTVKRPYKDTRLHLMRLVIAYYYNSGIITSYPSEQTFTELKTPGASILHDLIVLLRESPAPDHRSILEHWRDLPEYAQISKMAAMPIAAPEGAVMPEFTGAINN